MGGSLATARTALLRFRAFALIRALPGLKICASLPHRGFGPSRKDESYVSISVCSVSLWETFQFFCSHGGHKDHRDFSAARMQRGSSKNRSVSVARSSLVLAKREAAPKTRTSKILSICRSSYRVSKTAPALHWVGGVARGRALTRLPQIPHFVNTLLHVGIPTY
ncbi:hypothetical protein LEP1GSC192_3498 [Leptospira sp. B5-022]|nr:hypothetical protein LEP1GSC192_3498 [Leptospira sp. B5-022]